MTQIRTQSVAIKKGKVIIARILAGTDLISGIEKICQDNQIAYGTIVAAIGNLSRAKLVYAVVDKDAKFGINFSEPTSVEGPLELLSCQGMIGQSVKGELSVHLHGLLSDQDMKVYGGHFLKDDNPVLVTVEIMIHENQSVRMVREQDTETGFTVFKFYEL